MRPSVRFGEWAFKPVMRSMPERGVGPAVDVACRSLDDRFVVTALLRPAVWIDVWEAESGRRVCTVERHWSDVETLTADVCGERLLLSMERAGTHSPLELIDLASGETLATLSHPKSVRFVGMLHDGRFAVTTERFEDRTVSRVYNLDRRCCLKEWARPVEDMSPAAMAVSFCDEGVVRWCPLDGEVYGTLSLNARHSLGLLRVAPLRISADEQAILAFDENFQMVCVEPSGETLTRFDPIQLSDGGFDAGFSEGSRRCWVQTGALAVMGATTHPQWEGSGDCVLAPSRSGSDVWALCHVGLFDGFAFEGPLHPGARGHSGRVVSLATGDDGSVVSCGADCTTRGWTPDGVERWRALTGVCPLGQGKGRVLVVDPLDTLEVRDALSGEVVARVTLPERDLDWPAMTVSRDGRWCVLVGRRAGEPDRVVAVDLEHQKVLWRSEIRAQEGIVRVRRALPVEGSREVTVTGDDGFVATLSARDGSVLDQGFALTRYARGGDCFFLHNGAEALCLHGDGVMCLVGMLDASVRWRRADLVADLTTVAVSPCGRLFATALRGALRGSVALRRVDTGAVVGDIGLSDARDWPTCMVFSNDSRALFLGTMRGVVLCHDVSALLDGRSREAAEG